MTKIAHVSSPSYELKINNVLIQTALPPLVILIFFLYRCEKIYVYYDIDVNASTMRLNNVYLLQQQFDRLQQNALHRRRRRALTTVITAKKEGIKE